MCSYKVKGQSCLTRNSHFVWVLPLREGWLNPNLTFVCTMVWSASLTIPCTVPLYLARASYYEVGHTVCPTLNNPPNQPASSFNITIDISSSSTEPMRVFIVAHPVRNFVLRWECCVYICGFIPHRNIVCNKSNFCDMYACFWMI